MKPENSIVCMAGLIFSLLPGKSIAVQIDFEDFGRGVQVEDFESLSNMSGTLFEPLALNGNTFTTSSGAIRLFPPTSTPTSQVCLGGPSEGHAPNPGTCIGTGLADLETMDIALNTPSRRAGLWVGLTERTSQPQFWSRAIVSFLDEEDNTIGSVEIYGHTFGFAGWDVGMRNERIARLVIQDIAENNRVVAIDNLMWKSVPEPSSASLLALGPALAAIWGSARRRNAFADKALRRMLANITPIDRYRRRHL